MSDDRTGKVAIMKGAWARTLVGGLISLAWAVGTTHAQPPTDPPRWNILFCFADDWGCYARCYAPLEGRPSLNEVIQTPAVDRLAREGVLFRWAFVNSPSCTPCRSTLLSGRYFFQCGRAAILQGAVWDGSIPSFPLLLKDAGYQLGKSYKVWSPGTPADAPIGGQQFAYEQAGRMPNNFSEEVTKLMEGGATLEAARDAVLSQVRENFDAFLAQRQSGRPWLYWYGSTTTHRVWIKGSGKPLWGIDPEQLQGRLPAFLPDVPEVREDVADYLGECQAFDAQVGVLLKRLEEVGELERTLVIVSGDHGMPGVPHGKCNLYDHGVRVPLVIRVPGGKGGRVVEDLVSLVDLAPTLLEVGGVAMPPGLVGRSLLPLLRRSESGQLDPARDWVITGRERHVAAAREGNLPYPMRALRTREFLYIRNFAPDRWPMGAPGAVAGPSIPPLSELQSNTFIAFADMDASPTKAWLIAHREETPWQAFYQRAFGKRPAEELYDLKKDPDQVHNVADDPAYASVKEDLARRLMAILRDAGDPRVVGDGQTFDRPPFTDPVAPAGKAAKQAKKAKRG